MAQPKHKTDSTPATAATPAAAAPTYSTAADVVSELLTNVAAAVAARKDFLKTECGRLFDELSTGKSLLESLNAHAESLKVISAFNEGSVYQGMMLECQTRKVELLDLMKHLSEQFDAYRGEYNNLQRLSAKKESN